MSGLLRGDQVEFILDPDPAPHGPLAVLCGALLIHQDDPILEDAARLLALHRQVDVVIRDAGLAPAFG